MLKKISFIFLFILLIYSNAFAYDNYIALTYSSGDDSEFIRQQKEEQKIYGIEYAQRLLEFDHWWLSFEAAHSKHRYTSVETSFLIKCWGIYKIDIIDEIDLYAGIGIGLSSYKDNVLVKRNPSSSLGVRLGIEYKITEKVSITGEVISEHNSGIHKDDRGRNVEMGRAGIKFYF